MVVPKTDLAEIVRNVESAWLYGAWKYRAEVAEAAIADIGASISTAIGSNRWLDLPDGGDVSLAEQVTRMREALESAETELARLRSTTEMVSDKRVGEKQLLDMLKQGASTPPERVSDKRVGEARDRSRTP